MRKTHPVNALKKLGIGLAFGAATIMSMPASALACTQMYMGKNLTADGNTYYGRAEDYGKRYLKHFGIEDSHAPASPTAPMSPGSYTPQTKPRIATAMCAITPRSGMSVGMPTPKQASTRRASPVPPR